jgi:hypothetical protein
VVVAARAVMTGHCRPDEFKAVFAQATVFGVMPDRPGVWAAEIPGRGRWTSVFSTVERLTAYAGDCQFFSTTGADLIAQLPQGVGLILDPRDDHRCPCCRGWSRQGHLAAMTRQLRHEHRIVSDPAQGSATLPE